MTKGEHNTGIVGVHFALPSSHQDHEKTLQVTSAGSVECRSPRIVASSSMESWGNDAGKARTDLSSPGKVRPCRPNSAGKLYRLG